MKMQELKDEVRSSWETLNLTDGTPSAECLFKPAIRKFGDLRRKSTWIKAAIALEVGWILGGLENRDIIHYFCDPDTPVGREYNQEVLDELLTHKDALERIKSGLEHLYEEPIEAEDTVYALTFLKRISGYQDATEVLQAIALPSVA